MIRLSALSTRSLSLPYYRLQSLSPQNIILRQLSANATNTDSPPKGIPYAQLTIGIPKEVYPLEKRVAATPDVSVIEKHHF
jgi:hypothetical protein